MSYKESKFKIGNLIQYFEKIDNFYKCKICKKLVKHYCKHYYIHFPTKFKCTICNTILDRKNKLVNHYNFHHYKVRNQKNIIDFFNKIDKFYKCKICQKLVKCYPSHYYTHFKTGPACNICNFVSTNKEEYLSHYRFSHPNYL